MEKTQHLQQDLFNAEHTVIEQYADIITIKEFEKKPTPLRNSQRSKRKRIKTRLTQKIRRSDRSIQRSYAEFRKKATNSIYHSKNTPHFITLTFAQNLTDIKNAYKHLTVFFSELKKTDPNIKYISVPEFQKRGAVHFHVLIFNLRPDAHITELYNRKVQAQWAWGWVDIIATDGNPKIASYMAKYMQKAMRDPRLMGVKAYSSSRGLLHKMRTNAPLAVAYLKREFDLTTPESAIHSGLLTEIENKTKMTEWLGRSRTRTYRVNYTKYADNSDFKETDNQ